MSPDVKSKRNTLALVALISGIVNIVCFGGGLSLVPLITGILGLKEAKALDGEGKGHAIAGIVMGAVGLLISITALIIYIIFVVLAASGSI